MSVTTLTVTLDKSLADHLKAYAGQQRATVDSLVAGCIYMHLEVALRHKVLVERLEVVDAQIDAIAAFVEKAGASGGAESVDLSRLCRFPREA